MNPILRALQYVHQALGTPYVWGGSNPGGFDCSGLIQWAFQKAGVNLPRTTYDQVKYGRAVGWNQLRPGDLVFSNFEHPGAGATHVVVYIGNGKVIGAPHSGAKVEVEPLSWFQGHFVAARRVAWGPGGAALPTNGLQPIGNPNQRAIGPTGDGAVTSPTPNQMNPVAAFAAHQALVHTLQAPLQLPTAQGALQNVIGQPQPQQQPQFQPPQNVPSSDAFASSLDSIHKQLLAPQKMPALAMPGPSLKEAL